MTPLLGMPIWGRAEGQSSINVYRIDDGTLVHNFHATVPVDVATTIYTFREDEPEMRAKARNFAIRDTNHRVGSGGVLRGKQRRVRALSDATSRSYYSRDSAVRD